MSGAVKQDANKDEARVPTCARSVTNGDPRLSATSHRSRGGRTAVGTAFVETVCVCVCVCVCGGGGALCVWTGAARVPGRMCVLLQRRRDTQARCALGP